MFIRAFGYSRDSVVDVEVAAVVTWGSIREKGYRLLGFGRDFKQRRGEVLTSLQLNVQPVGACTKQYNKILEDPTDDLYELVLNTLPDGFEEDSLICAQIPGKNFNMFNR